MSVIDLILQKRAVPSPLFHYTSQTGLLGIVKSGEIWATEWSYLNDATEFHFAKDIANEVVSARIALAHDSVSLKLLKDMKSAIARSGINVCVCSFSEDGDSLSQWRGYSGNGVGYALGFNSSRLAEIAKIGGYILAPCIYDPAEQRNTMGQIVDATLEENIAASNAGVYSDDFAMNGRNFAYYLNRLALLFKDSTFSSEKEWRLISRPTSFARMAFRPGQSTVIPYQGVPITYDKCMLPITNIVVGPGPLPEVARSAVKGLLVNRNRKLSIVNVGNSVIPFRNW